MKKRGNNEGSVYRRTDGRGAAAVTVDGGRGRQKRKYLYGRTREEVSRKLTEILKAVQDHVPLPSDRITVAAFGTDWLKSIRPSIRPKTYESYESALRIHVIPRLGHIRLGRLTPTSLENLYGDLIEADYAPKSVRNYHACVHAMLEKAVRHGLVNRNVADIVDLPRRPRRDVPMITPEQARAFLRAASGHHLEALFALAITTAARQGELLGLTSDRVSLERREVEIRHALHKVNGRFMLAEPKTPHSVRTVALTDMAVEALRRHRVRQAEQALRLGPAWGNEFNLVFTTSIGTPLDKTNVTKRELRHVLRRAGLNTKLCFQDLRHIAATLALSQGTPVPVVSQMLGHSDPSTTLRVYAHVIPGAQRQAADALEAVFAG